MSNRLNIFLQIWVTPIHNFERAENPRKNQEQNGRESLIRYFLSTHCKQPNVQSRLPRSRFIRQRLPMKSRRGGLGPRQITDTRSRTSEPTDRKTPR